MSQRLQERYSPDQCVSFTRRHIRLNSQSIGAEVLSAAIEPFVVNLETAIAQVKTAEAEKTAVTISLFSTTRSLTMQYVMSLQNANQRNSIHSRQSAKLGSSSGIWNQLHEGWIKRQVNR